MNHTFIHNHIAMLILNVVRNFWLLSPLTQVVPFTPSAGVVEWVNGTVPLGDYLIGRSLYTWSQILYVNYILNASYLFAFFLGLYSTRTGGAHGRYGIGDWTYLQCREYLMSVCPRVVEVLYSIFYNRVMNVFPIWRNYIL
jgi:hypothetical protein